MDKRKYVIASLEGFKRYQAYTDKRITPLKYCLCWICVWHKVTPAEERLRQYALEQARLAFNQQISIADIEDITEADTKLWRSKSIAELSRLTGIEEISIQKNWGIRFDECPNGNRIYNLLVYADFHNRAALYHNAMPQIIKNLY